MAEAPQTKICAKCQIEKAIDEFGILRSTEDGHNPLCFECKRQRDQDSRDRKGKKAKTLEGKSKRGGPKKVSIPEEKIIAQQEEPAEIQLIKAFKKTTIKNFIKDDLIPILEKAVEERFK